MSRHVLSIQTLHGHSDTAGQIRVVGGECWVLGDGWYLSLIDWSKVCQKTDEFSTLSSTMWKLTLIILRWLIWMRFLEDFCCFDRGFDIVTWYLIPIWNPCAYGSRKELFNRFLVNIRSLGMSIMSKNHGFEWF